jgi:predicted Zn-dependent protease
LVRAELEDAIRTREQLLETLKKIESNAKRTEIKIDNTVAQLSTVYSQMQLLNSRQLDNSSAQRIRDSIREEIASLADIVTAMDEVYEYGQTKDYATALEGLQETPAEDAEADSQQAVRRNASGSS